MGRFEVVSLLGKGGFGEVYRALDRRLDREVAIKVHSSSYNVSEDHLTRFEQEARAAAVLEHPNILSIHDVGTHDGHPFVVAELLQGETVRDRIARGALAVSEVIVYGRQLAIGLAAAHAKGIAHRDLKPENLFITSDGRLKILDFGLATLASAAHSPVSASATNTQADGLVGTVGYMAPEQIRVARVDHRADLFAVGAVLYEMLTGMRAFEGATPLERLTATLANDPPLAFATTTPDACRLAAVIERCLAKTPEERFGSAVDLAEALEALQTPPTSTATRPVLAVRDLAMLSSAVAVVVIVLMNVLPRVRTERDRGAQTGGTTRPLIAVVPFRDVSLHGVHAYFAAGMAEEIRGQLSRVSALRVLSGSAVDAYSTRGNRRIAEDAGIDGYVAGTVRAEGDRVHVDVQLVDARTGGTRWSQAYEGGVEDVLRVESDVVFQIISALQATLSADERERIAKRPTANQQAYGLYLNSRRFSMFAREENHQGVDLLRKALALDPHFAVARTSLAYRLLLLGVLEESRYTRDAFDAAQQVLAIDPKMANAHFVLGSIYMQKGSLADARVSFLRAMNLDPNHSDTMQNLSLLELEQGHYDESFLWATRAFELEPGTSDSYYHVGCPLVFLGDDSVAERWLRGAEQQFPGSSRMQILLALLESLRGNDQNALRVARQTVQARPDTEEPPAVLSELTYLMQTADATALAEAMVRRSPADWDSINAWLVPESPRTRYAYLLAASGRSNESANLIETARASARKALDAGNQSPRLLMEMAATYAVAGDVQTATRWCERAYDAGWRDYRTMTRDPAFQSARRGLRFQTLLSRMKTDVGVMRQRVTTGGSVPLPSIVQRPLSESSR